MSQVVVVVSDPQEVDALPEEEEEEEVEEEVEEEEVVDEKSKKRPLKLKVIVSAPTAAVAEEPSEPPALPSEQKKAKTKRLPSRGYIPKQVVKDPVDARKIPRNEEEKGSKRIARTAAAQLVIDPDTDDLCVEVKKGRGTKSYRYQYYDRVQLVAAIKASMAKDKFAWLNYERLAEAYPDLYWNAIYHLDTVMNIETLLTNEGVPNGQRRRK